MYQQLIGLPRSVKSAIFLISDLVSLNLAIFIALMLRLNTTSLWFWFDNALPFIVLMNVVVPICTFLFRTYAIQLASFDISATIKVTFWAIAVTVIGVLANILFGLGAPKTVPVIMGPFLLFFALLSRYSAGVTIRLFEGGWSDAVPVAIYGAGSAGLQLASSLRSSKAYRPAFFIDESKRLDGVVISGLRVYGPIWLEQLINRYRIEKIFIAIPSITATKKKTLIAQLQAYGLEVLELPSFVEIIESGGMINSLRPVSPNDLLGRDDVDLDSPEITEIYQSKNIMVSGAGGSIGSELCRKIVSIRPKCLVLYEMSEYGLYRIEMELQGVAKQHGIVLVPVLGSVDNGDLLDATLTKYDISIVLHAAAYKHVPLIEENEVEGVRNNVLGTQAIAEAAMRNGVDRFILISTDKAVRPTNIMGATKRLAELLIQDLQETSQTTVFSIVRFGNVLGSSGSVIPLFREQIENGGPVTLTDANVTRYFMTIPEAARLVLLCGAYAEGGDVFVLEMGEAVKIYDLARQMIELAGLTVRDSDNPDGDIEIKEIGLRPGEKLYEELLIGENNLPTPHERILRAREVKLTSKETRQMLAAAKKAVGKNDSYAVRKLVSKYVSEFKQAQPKGTQ